MKPNEAKTKSMEARKRLVKEQLGNVRELIEEAAGKGGFSVSDHYYKFSSARSVGWLGEVVETLKMEGYTVNLEDGWLTISWGEVSEESPKPSLEVPELPSMLIKEGSKIKGAFDIPPIPHKDPHMIKEDGGGIVGMVIFGMVVSVLILLILFGLMFIG